MNQRPPQPSSSQPSPLSKSQKKRRKLKEKLKRVGQYQTSETDDQSQTASSVFGETNSFTTLQNNQLAAPPPPPQTSGQQPHPPPPRFIGAIHRLIPEEVTIDGIPYILKEKYNQVVKERDELRKELEKLKGQMEETQFKVLSLVQNQEIGEKTIQELQKENDILRKEIADRKRRTVVKLISIALSDLSIADNLATRIDVNLRGGLQDLNNGRIDDCHYINNNDRQDIKDFKKNVLLQKLNALTQQTIHLFDQYYDKKLLDEFKLYLQQYPPPLAVVDPRAENRAKMFWEDML